MTSSRTLMRIGKTSSCLFRMTTRRELLNNNQLRLNLLSPFIVFPPSVECLWFGLFRSQTAPRTKPIKVYHTRQDCQPQSRGRSADLRTGANLVVKLSPGRFGDRRSGPRSSCPLARSKSSRMRHKTHLLDDLL